MEYENALVGYGGNYGFHLIPILDELNAGVPHTECNPVQRKPRIDDVVKVDPPGE